MVTKYNRWLLSGTGALLCSVALSSCNFLDLKPLDQVSPEVYYNTADQLATFTIGKYPSVFPGPGSGWDAGMANWDNGTDNQAAGGGNGALFLLDKWKVPANGGIGFNGIRDLNKFINEVEAKRKDGIITGSEAAINLAIGEAYVIRALLYFQKLQAYGDYPIVDEVLNVDDDLVQSSKRMPRNEVARHILKDIDRAIALLPETASNKNRLTKNAALAYKSRIALYEGTFELYHRGTGYVPGDAQWPGKDREWNKGKTFDQQGEVNFFLTEAMNAAKTVADKVPLSTPNTHVMNPPALGKYDGWNPYYDMFARKDLSKVPEVLFWKAYNFDISSPLAHRTSSYLHAGANTGWTRGLVESFLMKNGLPIYADNSGYKGDVTIDNAKTNRDERLQLFLFGESTVLDAEGTEMGLFTNPQVTALDETKDVTGYRQRKFFRYDPVAQRNNVANDDSGTIQIRIAEPMLDYIEASYLLTGNIDGTARKYWTALRKRAGIEAPIETTINATDMGYEADVNRNSYDWGAFSAGKPVDATLYSIRRERRSEFAGEGKRMDDLVRWRALDQVKDYQIEGVNFWDEKYKDKEYFAKDEEGNVTTIIVADASAKANVSSKEITGSKYLRPYQIRKANNEYWGGYTFYYGHYLSPVSIGEMVLTSTDGKPESSVLYQTPYWPLVANGNVIETVK